MPAPKAPFRFLLAQRDTTLLEVPSSYAWFTFAEWGRKYGPLTYLNILGKSILILNTHEAAVDLLEKRALFYSDRPRQGDSTPLVSGAVHKQHRKLIAQALHPRIVERDFAPLQQRMTRQLAKPLLEDPDDFMRLIWRSTGEIMLTITYGATHDGGTDVVEMASQNVRNSGAAMAGHAVDIIPWLAYIPSWFPGAHFKREAKRYKKVAHDAIWIPFNMVKRQMAAGVAPTSFLTSLIEAQEDASSGAVKDDIMAAVAFSLFGAGSESMAGTLVTFVLAMTIHPDIQAKARAELDRVFGDRLPTVADRSLTPYLNAVMLETLRWNSSFPFAIPHKLTRDDVYNGYHIPAETIVIVNVWGIMHSEQYFNDPMVFNPDRYLPKENVKPTLSPWDVAFGYGRRLCQGMPFVDSGVWIGMATLLSTFNISPKVDPVTMKPLVPEARWDGGILSHPKPFSCNIVPRSQEHADRIKEAVRMMHDAM
ncbi:hypothetical protein FRB97_008983 [Tulasnella sp. 331]|nr:hypothetical protein FRB97_008983 [Tulasnella sp. 331]